MATVSDLVPGDIVASGPGRAIFVQRAPHPLYPGLVLVVWRMADGSWSHDALSACQHVGDTLPSTYAMRRSALRAALNGFEGRDAAAVLLMLRGGDGG